VVAPGFADTSMTAGGLNAVTVIIVNIGANDLGWDTMVGYCVAALFGQVR
jgi:lysophospholipase L1-like esterase